MINPVLTRAALSLAFLVAFPSMGLAYSPNPTGLNQGIVLPDLVKKQQAAIDAALGNAMNWA